MSNKRPLKAYVRYDGSGRAVSSSLIWRKNKPKVGNWKEVQGYECCDTSQSCSGTVSTSFTLQGTESSIVFVIALILECNNSSTGVVFSGWGAPAGGDTTIQEFIEILNGSISPDVATFTWGGGTTVNAQISSCLKSAICSDGELSIDFARLPD